MGAAALNAGENVQGASGGFLSNIFSPFKRRSKGRESISSSKSVPVCSVSEKSSLPRQYSLPNHRRIKSNSPSGACSPEHSLSNDAKLLQNKPKYCDSVVTSDYGSISSSRRSSISNDSISSNTLNKAIIGTKEDSSSGFLPQLQFNNDSTYVPKLKQGDDVKVKKQILESFIKNLPFRNGKILEKILPYLSSPKGIEKLYSDFSSPYIREQLCVESPLHPDQSKDIMESIWQSLHQECAKQLYLSSLCGDLDRLQLFKGKRTDIESFNEELYEPLSVRSSTSSSFLNVPGSRGSYSSIGSKGSNRGSTLSSYLQGEASDSSTTSSISSNTSNETVASHYNREHGPSVLHDGPKGLAERLGLEFPFETDKYGHYPHPRLKEEDSPVSQVSAVKVKQRLPEKQTHAKREEERRFLHAKALAETGTFETPSGVHSRYPLW
jgi:hypothetical protein